MIDGAIARVGSAKTLPAEQRGGVVAIGNFDGVHLGHQAVLGAARELALEHRVPLVCLTFEPHPRSFFSPERKVPRLTPAPMKAALLAALGFDAVVEQPFDATFAAMSAEAFVDDMLIGGLGAVHVVVGFDFGFGAKRAGTPRYLAEMGAERGFGVRLVAALSDESRAAISSSRVRAALEHGDLDGANRLLGYRWTVSGEVGHGQKIGRTLGFPTANLVLDDERLLEHGIYAVRLRRADGSLHGGVASYGRRPTFDNGAALFETFLFDFDADLYGETVAISLFARLRGEERFDTAEALVRRMRRDAEEAKAALALARPLSPLDRRVAF